MLNEPSVPKICDPVDGMSDTGWAVAFRYGGWCTTAHIDLKSTFSTEYPDRVVDVVLSHSQVSDDALVAPKVRHLNFACLPWSFLII